MPQKRADRQSAQNTARSDLAALLLALATENAELRQQLATAQDLLMETAIDAGHLHALVEAIQSERDAWRNEAEQLQTRPGAIGRSGRAAEMGTSTPPRSTYAARDLPTCAPHT